MKEIYYKQCILKKGNKIQTAWIPEKFAQKNKFIKLGNDNGWDVVTVGSTKYIQSYIQEREVDYKHQRAASDI